MFRDPWRDLHPDLRRVAELRIDRNRERSGQYLLEGVRAVETALRVARESVLAVYECEAVEWDRSLVGPKGRLPVHRVSIAEMEAMAATRTPQGLLAVAAARALRINWPLARRVTLVDALQEPGNLGALFRTSVAFGFDAMVLGRGTVDPWNPRTVRGSAGLVPSLPFETGARLEQMMEFLRERGWSLIGTSPHARTTLSSLNPPERFALLVGNEGRGAASEHLDRCDVQVRIPMAPGVESLNVAVAHGILASALARR